ncbi:hypothetical protein O3P69_016566 [Scylla paramamosain]|uniref:Uncharacterized protein n=1 Tax=Scylla paramamosain TaxID=85552 RepID=A0AAW0SYK7_SCYPA
MVNILRFNTGANIETRVESSQWFVYLGSVTWRRGGHRTSDIFSPHTHPPGIFGMTDRFVCVKRIYTVISVASVVTMGAHNKDTDDPLHTAQKLPSMQAFGWKRKAGLSKPRPAVFSEENVEERDGTEDPDVDWLTATKRPKIL